MAKNRALALPGRYRTAGVLVFHGVGMDVQYLHGEEGLRQNFLVSEEPDGNGPLRIDLHCSGPLLPRQTSTSGSFSKTPKGLSASPTRA